MAQRRKKNLTPVILTAVVGAGAVATAAYFLVPKLKAQAAQPAPPTGTLTNPPGNTVINTIDQAVATGQSAVTLFDHIKNLFSRQGQSGSVALSSTPITQLP